MRQIQEPKPTVDVTLHRRFAATPAAARAPGYRAASATSNADTDLTYNLDTLAIRTD
jgi:hypothetical protein